jgi:nucleotide-binding universal stress UspA family protein
LTHRSSTWFTSDVTLDDCTPRRAGPRPAIGNRVPRASGHRRPNRTGRANRAPSTRRRLRGVTVDVTATKGDGMGYTRLLVGTDGSATADKAVETAADLARQLNAELHIVTAYRSGIPGMASQSGAAMVDSGASEGLHADAAKQIVEKAAAIWGEGISTQAHAASGSAADVILDRAESAGVDLIIVGSKGMRGARRVLGSVPNSIAHGASCAVLIVKTD